MKRSGIDQAGGVSMPATHLAFVLSATLVVGLEEGPSLLHFVINEFGRRANASEIAVVFVHQQIKRSIDSHFRAEQEFEVGVLPREECGQNRNATWTAAVVVA